MNRRQFLEYTIALAAAAPVAFGYEPRMGWAPGWAPTQEDIEQWCEWYKLTVRAGCEKFADMVAQVFDVEVADFPAAYKETVKAVDGKAVEYSDLLEAAERAFCELDNSRDTVALAQGQGYAAGREGKPRANVLFTGPSNKAFAWYNGWGGGNRDYNRHQRIMKRNAGA